MVRTYLPVISVEGVRQALANLIRSPGAASRHPLSSLTLVDELLINTDFPRTENLQGFALNQIITDVITEEFSRLRRIHHLPEITSDLPLQDELKHIQADARKQVPALIIWSYLYYRYVRYELHLSPEQFADIIGLDKRTMQRYLQRGVEVLTYLLTIRESNARQRLRRQRLLTALPYPRAVTLIDRDELFLQADQALLQRIPRHFLISGAPGTGKSIFVSEWLRRRIEVSPENDPQALIWLNHPESIEHILQEMEDRLLPENSGIELRDYVTQNSTLLVIDGIDRLSTVELEHLLSYLNAAEVILIGYEYLALKGRVTHLKMRDFTADEFNEYLRFLLNTTSHDDADSVDYTSLIRETVGSNPLAMKLAIEVLLIENNEAAVRAGMSNIYQSYFDTLPVDLQRVWAAFTLIPESGLPAEQIHKIWSQLTSANLSALTNRYLIDRLPDDYLTIKPSARAYIQGNYQHSEYLADLVNEEFASLLNTWQAEPESPAVLACIEQILFSDFLLLDPDLEQIWLRTLLDYPEKRAGRWLHTLGKRFQRGQLDYELLIEFGSLLRHFHRWQRAQFILEQAILEAGRHGNFAIQAHALIEMAILFRIHHRLDQAELMLERAHRMAVRLSDATLIENIQLEKAQLAVERQDGNAALDLLRIIPESARALLLMAEGCLLTGNLTHGIELGLQALKYTRTDPLAININYVLLGRLYINIQAYSQAHDYLSRAVTRLEQMNQPFELARAITNLAITLIHLDGVHQAKLLMLRAESLQKEIRDVVGLAITQHNLNWLKTHRDQS